MTTTHRTLLAMSMLLAAGCGDSEPEVVDDGRFHPPANGVHISESSACDTLQTALKERALALGCTVTLRACPDFLRAAYSPSCAEYDEGAVNGCAEHFAEKKACDELDAASCVATHYPDAAPAGCP